MTSFPNLRMGETDAQLLLEEVSKLRETTEALVDRVEDVAASIRYMTNNLLDEQYHPEMADSVRSLAASVATLTSLSPDALPEQSLASFAGRASEVAGRCQQCINGEPIAEGTQHDAAHEHPALEALPPSIAWKLSSFDDLEVMRRYLGIWQNHLFPKLYLQFTTHLAIVNTCDLALKVFQNRVSSKTQRGSRRGEYSAQENFFEAYCH